MTRIKLYLVALLLMGLGGGFIAYKHLALGFPLWPGDKQKIWTVEATIDFNAKGGPVDITFTLPSRLSNMIILDEGFASSGYGFKKIDQDNQRQGQWTIRNAEGPQTLFYRLDIYAQPGANPDANHAASHLHEPISPEFDGPFKTAALALIKQARARSVDAESLTDELLSALNADNPTQEVQLLLGNRNGAAYRANLMVELLSLADIPVQLVRGLYLEDGRRRQPLSWFFEVQQGQQWLLYDPMIGKQELQQDLLLWQRGGRSLLDVVGGDKSNVSFSMISNLRATRDIAVRYGENADSNLLDFSIYSLPIAEQNAFKYILLIPIGALVVVLLRIVVGIRTSGTFMPILIALALLKTSLVPGLLMFLLVVSTGLIIRSYLSHLNLLLVARISAVIIVVVILMAGISILSNKLGVSQALTVTFFPMIILAWTIERMSILWEEDGPHEVMIQGGGSLVVAVITYLAINNRLVEYLTFNFPELLLVNLAIILLLGNYTGYRLSELIRFRSMLKQQGSLSAAMSEGTAVSQIGSPEPGNSLEPNKSPERDGQP